MKILEHIHRLISIGSRQIQRGAVGNKTILKVLLVSSFGILIETLDAAEKVRMLHELAEMIGEVDFHGLISDCFAEVYLHVAGILKSCG